MSMMDYVKGPQYKAQALTLEKELEGLKGQYDDLKLMAERCGVMELRHVQSLVANEREILRQVEQQVLEARNEAAAMALQIGELRSQVLVLDETLLLESFALYVPKFSLVNSSAYKERLDQVREQQKSLVKSGSAAVGNMNWEVNGKKSEGKKLVNDMIKLVIRSFNNECDYCVDNVKFDNVELGEKRIRQSFDACNKLGRVMTVYLSDSYLALKLQELYLAHEFQIKKQEEKEAAKRAREELREQQKLEQEIRAARDKIAKERKHFAGAIRDLQARLDKASDDRERSDLQARLAEVQDKKDALDQEEKVIDYREQNAKAGYVYIISNVGVVSRMNGSSEAGMRSLWAGRS